MVDVPHDRDDRRPRLELALRGGLADGLEQLVLERRFPERLRGVPHLLDDEHGRVLVDDLVDRDHHAHAHQRLYDLGAFHGEALSQIADRDRLGDLDLANDGRRRTLEAVLRVDRDAHLTAALRALLAAPRRRALGHVQRVIGRPGLALALRLARALGAGAGAGAGSGSGLGFLGLRGLGRDALLLGLPPSLGVGLGLAFLGLLLLGLAARLLLALGGLAALALETLRLLALLALFLGPRLLDLATLGVELLLLLACLLLEHVALDVRALLPDLDVDGARAPLAAREPELALRLAAQRDARGRGVVGVLAPVRTAQVRQQLELGVLADDVVGAGDLDAGLVELVDEAINRDLEGLGEFRDFYLRHGASSLKPAARSRTSGPEPP